MSAMGVFLKILAAILLLICAAAAFGSARAARTGRPPLRGELVDIGGRRLRIVCTGPRSGRPLIVMAGLKLAAAFCIKKRKSRVFCMVVAAIECLEIPYGTLIGVCTFIVLDRDSVIRLFDANAAKASAGA